jgi:hypothetical protein
VEEEEKKKRGNMTEGEEKKEVKNWAQTQKSSGKRKERKEAIKV